MTTIIDASRYWVDTHIHLRAGVSYSMVPNGRWLDATIESGPEGYASQNVFQRITEWLRRVPAAPWFALVGAIDRRSSTQFVIGAGCVYRAERDGELTCFANDLCGFYWNNHGSVNLDVTEVSGATASTRPPRH